MFLNVLEKVVLCQLAFTMLIVVTTIPLISHNGDINTPLTTDKLIEGMENIYRTPTIIGT